MWNIRIRLVFVHFHLLDSFKDIDQNNFLCVLDILNGFLVLWKTNGGLATSEKAIVTDDVEPKVCYQQSKNGALYREVQSDGTSNVQTQETVCDNAALYSHDLNEDDVDRSGIWITIRKCTSNANGNPTYTEDNIDDKDIFTSDDSNEDPDYNSLEKSDKESSDIKSSSGPEDTNYAIKHCVSLFQINVNFHQHLQLLVRQLQ